MMKRIGLLLGCGFLLFISLNAVFRMKSTEDKQNLLIAAAQEELEKRLPANAIKPLTDAAAYNTSRTLDVLLDLKNAYYDLGNGRDYVNLLKKMIARTDCPVSVYKEYAQYLLERNKLADAFDTLKLGISKTDSQDLINLYEANRYAYTISGDVYEDVTEYHNGGIQVKRGELWGLANAAGTVLIPCEYTQLSSYDTAGSGCVIAMKQDKLPVTLNLKNQVIARYGSAVEQIGNLSQGYVTMQTANGKWIFANHKMETSGREYDALGSFSNGAAAMQVGGKWGVSSMNGEVLVPYEYDAVIMDETGCCYAQNAVFVRKGNAVYLFADGTLQNEAYEDAKPFPASGWAAVKKNGKWGFINTTGKVEISYLFDDALSFGQHLAAVKQGELWGYAGLDGTVVTEMVFLQAKSFLNGHAPVLTNRGWQFITLIEYKKGVF